jgi:alcohol dehydrogenase class IV
VLSQSLVRFAGASHGQANAIMLPHTLAALEWRFPAWYERLGEVLGRDPSEFAAALCARSGPTALNELGITDDTLDECANTASERAELDLTPPRADRAELRAIYETAH